MDHARQILRLSLDLGIGEVTKRARRLLWLSAAGVGAMVALVLAYPDILHMLRQPAAISDPGIPTSFSGNRAAYGFALFSLFCTTSLSFRKLILLAVMLKEEPWRQDPDVGFHRMALALLLLVVLIGAGPDVLILLLWGEADPPTMVAAMTFDRICDGLTIIPFLGSIFCMVKAEQFQRHPTLPAGSLAPFHDVGPGERHLFIVQPRAESIAENVKIIVFVMLLAAGLAIWK